MEVKELETRLCPKCGNVYNGRPALSREDNEMLICPDCSVKEALTSLGLDETEQNKILKTIHRHTSNFDSE